MYEVTRSDDGINFNPYKKTNGEYVSKVSDIMTVDEMFILRGKERFNIYCSVCHGYTGVGNGLVAQNNKYPLIPVSLHSTTLDDKKDGYFFWYLVL